MSSIPLELARRGSLRTPVRTLLLIGIACWLVGAPLCVRAQSSIQEQGLPILTNITPDEYGAHTQNWDVAQDPRGFVYVANGTGVLEYDGARWRRIPLPGGHRMARNIAVAPDTTIYVTGQSEIGYLAPDDRGALRYVSLLPQIPDSLRPTTSYISLGIDPDGSHVYFAWDDLLYIWDGARMQIVRASDHFGDPQAFFYLFHQAGDALYATGRPHSLMRLDDGGVHPIPGLTDVVQAFVSDVIPYEEEWLILASDGRGLFHFNGHRARPFATEVHEWIQSAEYVVGTAVPGRGILLASWNAGGVWLDRNGRLVHRLNQATGLRNEAVSNLGVDRAGGVWMLLNNGIAHARFADPVTLFDDRLDLDGSVADIHRHTDGRLYATTEQGLFRLTPGTATSSASFDRVGPPIEAWGMTSVDDALLVATADGLHRMRGATLDPVGETDGSYLVHRSTSHPWLLHVASYGGYRTVDLRTRPWTMSAPYEAAPLEGRSLAETPDGTVWMGTYDATVYRIRLADDGTPQITAFDTDDGLPEGEADVDVIAGRVVASTGDGFYRFDPTAQRFVPDDALRAAVPDPSAFVEVAFETGGGHVVAARHPQPDMAVELLRKQDDGTYVRDSSPLAAVPRGSFHIVHTDPDSTVWIGGAFGIARYDASASVARPPLEAHVRDVHAADSLLFGGTALSGSTPILPASTDRLRFAVAAPVMPGLPPVRYRVRLDGFDETWSAWSTNAQTEYTNLSPGTYTLRARAQSPDGRTSPPVAYTFAVEAPWYRTVWAYGMYALLFAGLVASATRYLSQLRLRRQVQQLETERHLQQERERISRDLHDHVGAQLSNIKSGLELVRLAAHAGQPQRARKHLLALDEDVELTMSQLRDTIWALHGEAIALDELGRQVERFLERQTRYRDRPSVSCTVDASPDTPLSPIQALHVFRIIQEAVTNALKHANADTLTVRLQHTDAGNVEITVRDDGVGLRCPPEEVTDGYGLANVKARAEEMNGDVHITENEPSGTTVRVTVPVRGRDA